MTSQLTLLGAGAYIRYSSNVHSNPNKPIPLSKELPGTHCLNFQALNEIFRCLKSVEELPHNNCNPGSNKIQLAVLCFANTTLNNLAVTTKFTTDVPEGTVRKDLNILKIHNWPTEEFHCQLLLPALYFLMKAACLTVLFSNCQGCQEQLHPAQNIN